MKKFSILLILATTLTALNYEGCGTTKKEALANLSNNISTTVSTNFENSTTLLQNGDDEDVKAQISSYIKTKSTLKLVNVHYKKKDDKTVCAYVSDKEQKINTKKLLQNVQAYSIDNLPSAPEARIATLRNWIEDIENLKQMVPVFLEDQSVMPSLEKKRKEFYDLYTQELSKANSLIWKSCASNEKKAKEALNKHLFAHLKEEKKEEGFFSSVVSLFSAQEEEPQSVLDFFPQVIHYSEENGQKCAFIKKSDLYEIAKKLFYDLKHIHHLSSLSADHQKRYKQLTKLLQKIDIAKALLPLFPKKFSISDMDYLEQLHKKLLALKEKTYPQYLIFHIQNAKDLSIEIDGKRYQNNEKIFLPTGEHTFIVKAKGSCPIKENITLEFNDDQEIEKDMQEYAYPTVLFISDVEPSIVVDGKNISANRVVPIPKCDQKIRYIATYNGQKQSGELELLANENKEIDLHFLTPKEQEIFNDAKTKYFSVTQGVKISESLTPISDEKITFHLKENAEHGTLELDESGVFQYKSEKNFSGIDSFEYYVEIFDKRSAPKVVNIKVEPSLKETTLKSIDKTVSKQMDKGMQAAQKVEKKIKKVQKEVKNVIDETKYAKFKAYAEILEQRGDIEKLKKLQKKYPTYFQKLLEEKVGK